MIDELSFLTKRDPVLAEIADHCECSIPESTNDIFYDLVTCVLEQQIHYRARGVYVRKFMDVTEGLWPTAELILTIDPHDFAKRKIAGNKLKTLQNLAHCWIDHDFDQINWHVLDDDEVRSHLAGIAGIGPWTINMILLYTLQRPDIFDPNDYQLKKVMADSYGLRNDKSLTKEMTAIAAKWKPYRSSGVFLILAWRNQMKKQR